MRPKPSPKIFDQYVKSLRTSLALCIRSRIPNANLDPETELNHKATCAKVLKLNGLNAYSAIRFGTLQRVRARLKVGFSSINIEGIFSLTYCKDEGSC